MTRREQDEVAHVITAYHFPRPALRVCNECGHTREIPRIRLILGEIREVDDTGCPRCAEMEELSNEK